MTSLIDEVIEKYLFIGLDPSRFLVMVVFRDS